MKNALAVETLVATGRTTARIIRPLRLNCAHEGTQELAVYLGSECVGIDAGGGEEFAGVVDFVNTSRLNLDVFKAGSREFCAVVVFLQGTGDAADPQENAFTNLGCDLAASDDVRDGKAAARL